jgi:ABC-type sugar transport system permease subunit
MTGVWNTTQGPIRFLWWGSISLLLVYFVPFIKEIDFSNSLVSEIANNRDGFVESLFRSFVFAVSESVLLVLLSILVAISLSSIPLHSFRGKCLSFLLLPVLIGNVSTAFLWKILLTDVSFFFRNAATTFLAICTIDIWQYGTLFTYLFWITIKFIPSNVQDYCGINKLNFREMVRDIYLPALRNLSLLLLIVGFVFCFYEDAKIQFIFKASRGMDTELINQWLNRTYQSTALLDPTIAFEKIASLGVLVLLFSLVVLFAFLLLKNYLFGKLITSQFRLKVSSIGVGKVGTNTFHVAILAFTLAPIAIVWTKQQLLFESNLTQLSNSALLTIIASIVASTTAIVIALLTRLFFRDFLGNLNKRSMAFLVLLFLLVVIPPICTLLLGFKWMQIFGYRSQLNIHIAWIVGHTILCLPLLGGFSVTTHFKVDDNQLVFLESQKASLAELMKDIFILPFRVDYLLTMIIAFSLIWNESTINKILSDFIPSFITELDKTIFGRSADYAKGMNYLLISILFGFLSVFIWNYILNKSKSSNRVVAI